MTMTLEEAQAFTRENKYVPDRMDRMIAPLRPMRDGRCACWGTSKSQGSWHWHQCSAAGKVTLADGSTWCGTHSPEAIARRKAKRDEAERIRRQKVNAYWDAAKEKDRRTKAYPALVAALRAIRDGDNDPRATARAVLIEAGEPE